MSNIVGKIPQIINFNYKENLSSNVLNKLFYQLFTPGVIHTDIDLSGTTLTLNEFSGLIKPSNFPDILVKVDTTQPIVFTGVSTSSPYLVVRMIWNEDENNSAEFLLTTSPQETDIIIAKIVDDGGNLTLDYSETQKSNSSMIYSGMSITDAGSVDCATPGSSAGNIPINNGVLMQNLVAHFISGKALSDLAKNNGDLMNVKAKKIDNFVYADVAIKNGTLQINLNADKLNGKDYNEYSTCTNGDNNNCLHPTAHDLQQINDGVQYKKLSYVDSATRKITTDAIKDGEISTALNKFAMKDGIHFTPIFEYGTVSGRNQVVTVTSHYSYKRALPIVNAPFGCWVSNIQLDPTTHKLSFDIHIQNNVREDASQTCSSDPGGDYTPTYYLESSSNKTVQYLIIGEKY